MKHTESTQQTKRALADALKTAMREKPFQKITVSELVVRAGLNRKTFYYHFQDIYALLKWVLEEDAERLVSSFDMFDDYEEAIAYVMNYAEENEYIISCAYDSISRDELKRSVSAGFSHVVASVITKTEEKEKHFLDPSYRAFLTEFYKEALSGLMVDWVRERGNRDRDAMIRNMSRTIRDSLAGILYGYGAE